jgi:hypothetical protein
MKKTNTSNPGPKTQTKKKASRRKNPLYVVTNQGKVVEQATGPFDAMIKRFGLEPALKIINNLMEMLLAQVNSFPALVAFNNWLEQTIKSLELFAKRFAPFLFFYS